MRLAFDTAAIQFSNARKEEALVIPGPREGQLMFKFVGYLIWQVRQIKLPRPAVSVPLIFTIMPLEGAEPISLWGSWHEVHCIL